MHKFYIYIYFYEHIFIDSYKFEFVSSNAPLESQQDFS